MVEGNTMGQAYVLDPMFVSAFEGEVSSYMNMPVHITVVNIIVMSVYI